MIVTVMSDASFDHITQASGYGVWAKSQRGNYQAGGNFKGQPRAAAEAEAMAVTVALFAAVRWGVAAPGDKIIMQSDCQMVIDAHNGKMKRAKRHTQLFTTVDWTKQFLEENNLTIEFRHVRAHVPKEGKRNYINNVCDKLAKKAMRKQQKERRKPCTTTSKP